ncbi:ABC transporter ATP-binding protein [Chlorogloeopsis sp. ULAP01]|uniref:ATP-binding cassette domain-containing protein n=1 Tax=Chlorogloeopsis sp. ULAP01 TaxID=3056483 RepID=UPI0025AA6D70|nr:ABC transporter ATP-binding protein [Chlorogloeopsis sp. ULAP01]MDM9383741.1 ABC transporter ATP-binding protein [Chlorogloeopsis sp. ULAP01]
MKTKQKLPTWTLLWQIILYNPKLYALDSIIWVFGMGLPILPGLIIQAFFDTLTGESTLRFSAWAIIALLLATGLARIVFIFVGRFTNTQYRFLTSSLLQRNLLEHLLHCPGAKPLVVGEETSKTVSTGEVISYFRDDISQIEETVAWIGSIPGYALIVLGSVAILLSINVRITVFVFLPLAVIAAIVQGAETRLKRYRQASRNATQQVTGIVGDIFAGVQTIKVAGAQTDVLNYFNGLNEQRRQLMLKDQVLTATLESVLQNIVNLGTGGILLLVARSLQSGLGALSVGDFALFVYYLSFITGFLDYLGRFIMLCKQTEVSFERLAALLSGTPAQTLVAHHNLYLNYPLTGQPALPPIAQPVWEQNLRLRELMAFNLTYHYPDTNQGISGIDLKLVRGSLTVITGRVCAGKTTLLRVLLGLLPLEAGSIYWNGCKVENPTDFFVPPRSAYTPQIPQFFSTSLQENILLGLEKDEMAIEKAIYQAVFEQDLAAMSQGLDTIVGPKGVRLSGGQLQRAAAARMFVRQPELLVFDDLSSALDVETERKLWSRLFASKREVGNGGWYPTCLVVSHRPWVLRHADCVIVLRDGKIEAQGKFDDVRKICIELQ